MGDVRQRSRSRPGGTTPGEIPHGRSSVCSPALMAASSTTGLPVDLPLKPRDAAFIPSKCAPLLARHPYGLRHGAVSTWLNTGVPSPRSPRVHWAVSANPAGEFVFTQRDLLLSHDKRRGRGQSVHGDLTHKRNYPLT